MRSAGGLTEFEEPIWSLIRRARRAAGYSQLTLATTLAAMSGNHSVTRDVVARWERGRRIPGPYWREWLSTALRVPGPELETASRVARQVRLRQRATDAEQSPAKPPRDGARGSGVADGPANLDAGAVAANVTVLAIPCCAVAGGRWPPAAALRRTDGRTDDGGLAGRPCVHALGRAVRDGEARPWPGIQTTMGGPLGGGRC